MSELKYKNATGFTKWLMNTLKQKAVVLPNGVCYTTWSLPLWPEKQRHEEKHWEQYQEYGRFKFVFIYLKELVKKGYWHNRFEVEARRAEKVVSSE